MAARATMPKGILKLKARVGWPKALKRERVGLAFLALAMKGHINVPVEHLSDVLIAYGFPQIAFAVREQVEMGRVCDLNTLGPDDEYAIRMFVKKAIKESENGK